MRQQATVVNRNGALGSTDVPNAGAALPWESASAFESVSDLPDDRLETQIIGLVTRMSSATYELLRLIGEHDERGVYLLSGALSCAAWLADRCDIERVTAHNQVRVARAMRAFPELDAAMACGDVSYAKARMLTAHLSVEHAAELVHLASVTPTSGLATALACWSHRTESQDDIDARHHAERSVWWWTDPDGMVRITGRRPTPAPDADSRREGSAASPTPDTMNAGSPAVTPEPSTQVRLQRPRRGSGPRVGSAVRHFPRVRRGG